MKKQYQVLKKILAKKGSARMAVSIQGDHMGTQMVWDDETCAVSGEKDICDIWKRELRAVKGGNCVAVGKDRIFVQDYSARPDLVILGGGHISRTLVALGKIIGFRVTVADDRPEFASAERFPEADRILCGEYEEIFDQIPESTAGYYVIVTRGHQGDEICVRRILKRSFSYVGMIGSRKKVAQTRENLEKEGISSELLERLHAPIGLKIGAVTPEEIAVSIAAELIQVKSGTTAGIMDEEVLEALLQPVDKILVMIVEKHGSAPRGTGACMAVGQNGAEAGTIGGGAVEYEACRHAVRMLKEGAEHDLRNYELNNIRSAELGMICGGSNQIFFLRV